jgi:hypothetical protein
MVPAEQSPNYINLCKTTEKYDVRRTPSKVRIPRITKLFHATLEIIRMITSHLSMNNERFAAFRNIESMLGLRNRTLLDIIVPHHGGVQFHGRITNLVP